MVQAVFVVGTGRSGTHFTCRALAGFEQIFDPNMGSEHKTVLKKIALAAIRHRPLPGGVLSYYKMMRRDLPAGRVFLDQHHPNLFFFRELAQIFEDLVFVCPDRPLVQVVASMLRHEGVMAWFDFARQEISAGNELPFPNRFLGTETSLQLFELEPYELCARRVLSHRLEMQKLVAREEKCRFLSYECLIEDQIGAFGRVFSAEELGQLGHFSIVEEGQSISLKKYEEVLTPQQIEHLARMDREAREFKKVERSC